MKICNLIFCFLSFLFFTTTHTFALNADEAFLDIERDYKYYNELQYLYDEWYITPDEWDLLNPDRTIKKWELSAWTYKLNCGECIQPKTSPDLLTIYNTSNSFFDILRENEYFYCSEASKTDGLFYDLEIWDICDNWISQEESVPFC